MQTEDIIELGSSDEEPGPPPPKKMNVRNAMVHIPTKFHGVTIKPVKGNTPNLPKLGKNITITKTSTSATITSKVKPPDKPLQKLAAAKKKCVGKKVNQGAQPKGKVFNPLSQVKKNTVAVGNPTIPKLKTPIQIKKLPMNKPQPLQRLPPSITIKKTGTTVVKPGPNIVTFPKIVSKVAPKVSKKRKIEVVQTVELDDDEASTSSNNHQWYVRPEDQKPISPDNDEAPLQEKNAKSQEKAAITKEDTNNKEPEGPKYIEITIEDSPIKPTKTKRTRELSTEKIITIDDSPNKGGVVSGNVDEASDSETTIVKKKVPHSKKKLKYAADLQRIEETQTIEIEIEPMEPHGLNTTEIEIEAAPSKESRVVSLTPDIMEVEEGSVEIAQNTQGEVSVVQNKPLQSKENTKRPPIREAAIKSEFHPVYQSFISLCIQLENSNDMEKIIEKKIKPYYRQVPKEYRESDEFLDMVSSKITAMESAPEKMYLYIKDIVDELNLQRKFLKETPLEEKSADDSFLYGKENELDPNKQRQIRKLEKTLKKLNRAIQKLESQEVDFDDEEDSVYLLTEKYKERMVRVHAKFCQLTNTKMPSQPRVVIDPRPGLSAAPAKRLEAWINKKDGVVFPDFHDVLRCVREANEQDNLGWNEACIVEEARDLFTRCGRKLQRRRQENEWRIATSRIQPNSDPAEQSDELRKQLEANRRLANTKETEVFDKFCDRQSQLKLEAVEIDDKEAEESPVESEEEDNDEIPSLESKEKRKDRLRRLLQEQSKKIISTKVPQKEQDITEESENVEESVGTVAENNPETVNEEDKIQSLSDDSNEIGSDMDELHLLQKLHSDNEIRTESTSDSDSETPIAISDSLDSSSDDGKRTKPQSVDVISIENSSYSDESDSQKNNASKINKKHTVSTKELTEESKEIECTSSSVVKNSHLNDPTLENTENNLSSSDNESNPDDNMNSGNSDNSSKVSFAKEGKTPDKDSDAEDEQSTNSDIMPGSSVSSGQYEELLKEHNADPLLKEPDLIPQDPSDKLFDSMVMKHYNDPLIKKTLKGSDSSNGSPFAADTESLNSDTRSPTVEEAKRDLIESSVDTEELLNCNSTSIVDKFIEKIKQSDGSHSSDSDFFRKVDQELGLSTEVSSPVTFELQKEVDLARQTKAWPRFRDECSSFSSADDDSTVDDSSKPNMTEKKECEKTEITSNKSKPSNCPTKDNESKETNASAAECSKNVCKEMEVEYSETVSTKESMDAVASSSGCAKDSEYAHEAMDITESETAHSEQTKETDHGKLDTNVVSHDCPDEENETLTEHDVLGELLNSNIIPKEKTDTKLMDILDSKPNNANGSELVSNGSLNINMDISEILHNDAGLPQKNDGGDKNLDVLDELNEHLSAEKGDCDDEAIPRTIPSVCVNSSEGNN